MVLEKLRPLGEFHARLQKVSDDRFRAEYSGEINPGKSGCPRNSGFSRRQQCR
jgi:hypothetical protein